jgi:Predicted Zn peptidase
MSISCSASPLPLQTAAALRLAQRNVALQVHPLTMQYPLAIRFDSMENFCKRSRITRAALAKEPDLADGCTIILENSRQGTQYLVLYNGLLQNRRRCAFTLAHEIGHILLEHRKDGPDEEKEADAFAAELLAPRILVWAMGQQLPHTVLQHEIMDAFFLSRQAAANRLVGLRGLSYSSFLPAERALLSRLGSLLPSNAPRVSI